MPLIVHHGLLWEFQGVQPIRGAFGRRVRPLIEARINLFGYHLPLDGYLEVGNAAGIAKGLALLDVAAFGLIKGMPSGVQGRFDPPLTVSSLRLRLESLLRHPVLVSTADESASTNQQLPKPCHGQPRPMKSEWRAPTATRQSSTEAISFSWRSTCRW